MNCFTRSLAVTLSFSAIFGSAMAATGSNWNGTWSGAWGGSRPTSITIAQGRVVSYEYGGASTPVARSIVTGKRVIYGDNGVRVTLTQTYGHKALATLHTSQGDTTATLTRQ